MTPEKTSNNRYIAACTKDTKEIYMTAVLEQIKKDGLSLVGEVREYPCDGEIIRLSAYAA